MLTYSTHTRTPLNGHTKEPLNSERVFDFPADQTHPYSYHSAFSGPFPPAPPPPALPLLFLLDTSSMSANRLLSTISGAGWPAVSRPGLGGR